MTKIPSIEKTEDSIFRLEIKKGSPPTNSDAPHLLAFEQFIEPVGIFHSMDVTIFRDGQRANDVEFYSFQHVRQPTMTYIHFAFHDYHSCVAEHDYLLTVVLRYLI